MPKLGIVLFVSTMAQLVFASPQHAKLGGAHPRFEAKQRQILEMRANRQALRQAKQQQAKDVEIVPTQSPPIQSATTLSNAVQQNQGAIEREVNPRFNRLTPEERQALRRQIKEARREIYLQRQQ